MLWTLIVAIGLAAVQPVDLRTHRSPEPAATLSDADRATLDAHVASFYKDNLGRVVNRSSEFDTLSKRSDRDKREVCQIACGKKTRPDYRLHKVSEWLIDDVASTAIPLVGKRYIRFGDQVGNNEWKVKPLESPLSAYSAGIEWLTMRTELDYQISQDVQQLHENQLLVENPAQHIELLSLTRMSVDELREAIWQRKASLYELSFQRRSPKPGEYPETVKWIIEWTRTDVTPEHLRSPRTSPAPESPAQQSPQPRNDR